MMQVRKSEKNVSSNFGSTITTIMQVCGVDFSLEKPLDVENKLHLSVLQRE